MFLSKCAGLCLYLCLCVCVCMGFFAVCLCRSLKFCVYLCLLLLRIWHSISISFLLITCIIFNEAFTYNVFDTTYNRVTCCSTLSGHPSSSFVWRHKWPILFEQHCWVHVPFLCRAFHFLGKVWFAAHLFFCKTVPQSIPATFWGKKSRLNWRLRWFHSKRKWPNSFWQLQLNCGYEAAQRPLTEHFEDLLVASRFASLNSWLNTSVRSCGMLLN